LSEHASDLWVHGHVHDGFDYTVGRTRVVANPAGYILNRRTAQSRGDFRFENETFDPNLVLEV
jgi:Icc-related predicted phosphoesterase